MTHFVFVVSYQTVKMGEENVISNSYVFRGMEYIVSMIVDDQQGNVTVEVEDRLTSDQWRGTFDAACKYPAYTTFSGLLRVHTDKVILPFMATKLFYGNKVIHSIRSLGF